MASRITAAFLMAIGVATASLVYFITRLMTVRRFNHSLPGPPHSKLWGHLKIIGALTQKLPEQPAYIQAIVTEIKKQFDLPDIFYLDLWPFGPLMLILSAPDAVTIPTTASNFPQHEVVTSFFDGNIGTSFVEATNGTLFKELHQAIAPALTPTASKTYLPSTLDRCRDLVIRLDKHATAGFIDDLQFDLGLYPFQVLGCAFFGSQLSQQAYKDSLRMAELIVTLNTPGALLNPLTKRRWENDMFACRGRLEAEASARIQARIEALLQEKQTGAANGKGISILDRMILHRIKNDQPFDDKTLQVFLENAKGFIVAGWGTTTDSSTYMLMLLSSYPDVIREMRAEHDRVLGSNPEESFAKLHENPGLLNDLKYTTATVQETLRLYPIGMSARQAPDNVTSIQYKGKDFPIAKGQLIIILGHAIHYNPEIFPQPSEFNPSRFLEGNATYPRPAYRPFEQGVRSCLGKTLATDEMKILLVMLVRRYDFELVNHSPNKRPLFSHTDLDTKLGKHAFPIRAFTATPAGPVKMKIRRV